MEERKKTEEPEELASEKRKKANERLPYCTTAPSPEHHRAHDDDGPCDDGRGGDVD
jgi:hypothetical protein